MSAWNYVWNQTNTHLTGSVENLEGRERDGMVGVGGAFIFSW